MVWTWLRLCGVGVASGRPLSGLMLLSSTASRETVRGTPQEFRQRRWVLTRAAASGGDSVLSFKDEHRGRCSVSGFLRKKRACFHRVNPSYEDFD